MIFNSQNITMLYPQMSCRFFKRLLNNWSFSSDITEQYCTAVMLAHASVYLHCWIVSNRMWKAFSC